MKHWYTAFMVLTVLLLAVTTVAAQEQGTLTGTVTEAGSSQGLPGVNVVIPALNRGAATTIDGVYTLADLPAGTYEVSARFVGFRPSTQEVTIVAGAEATLNFELQEDFMQMDQTVVTGTGLSTERRRLSADVSVISTRDIEESPVASVDQLLQGRVSGSSVRMQSAQPGQGALINFRGITSAFADQTPVIYVDGVRVDNNTGTSFSFGGESTSALSELLTNDIERIEITKGGAASTLYGSDAANGVIQIFTRRGQEGQPVITLRTEQGIDLPNTQFLLDTGFSFASNVEDPDDPDFGRANFIRDEILRTAHTQNYYTGVSGGTSDVTYNVSGRVQQSGGVQPNNASTLYALRGNVETKLANTLNVSFSGAYTRSNFSRINNGTAIADPLTAFEVGDAKFFSGASTLDEALDLFLLPTIKEGVDRFTLSTTASYTPSELFSSRLTGGIDSRSNEQRRRNPAAADALTGNDGGLLTRFDRNFNAVTLEYQGTISYPREGRLTSDFTFGAQGFREETSTIFGEGETFALPGTEDFGEAGSIIADETRSQIFNGGFFFREQLGIDDRLFLNAGIRFDGNSAFGDDVGLQAYPSVGAAYNISDENFWRGRVQSIFSELKLRAAYGATGKFPTPFARDVTFQANAFRGEAAPRFDNPGNADLRPERTATLEAGFETSLLRDVFGLNITGYRSITSDAIFSVPEQPVTGRGAQLRNVGEIRNRGIELDADLRIFNRRNVRWSLGAAYGYVENAITDMGGAADFNVSTTVSAQQRVSEGRPVGAWRATTPFDSNGDGLLDASEFRFTDTTPFPDHTGSISTRLTLYNRLNLFALADWATGAEVFDWGSHWAQFNGLERAPRPTRFDTEGNEVGKFSTAAAGTALLQSGDYLKLREIAISYRLPERLIEQANLRSAQLSLTGRNLLTFARQDFVDPELAGLTSGGGLQLGGAQSITLSPPRQLRLSLEVTL
ncbi:MAG: SusC/RagA family TonB-linked outer membrane protein [Bacteroidetes bacterium]|jgi:TonB-linked SusC/RagA family outer membrane protein|nr:SusC/RagA family TonB-linked outer membrane protein [Bacteroidota bacterium]